MIAVLIIIWYAAIAVLVARPAAWRVARYAHKHWEVLYAEPKPSALHGADWFIVAFLAWIWPLAVPYWLVTMIPGSLPPVRALRWWVTHETASREAKQEKRLRELDTAVKAAESRLADVTAELCRMGIDP